MRPKKPDPSRWAVPLKGKYILDYQMTATETKNRRGKGRKSLAKEKTDIC